MSALLAALEIGSWFRRRLAWAVVAAGLVLGALAWGLPWGRPAVDPCSHPERQLAGIWDDGVKGQLKAAFDRFGEAQAKAAFPAIEHDLDRYVEGWTSARTQACEETHVRKEQGQDVLELRLSCLDRRRRELAAFVQLLQTADAQTVSRAAQTASTLPDLSGCADIAALLRRSRLPAKESDRTRVEELRGQLAQAEAYRASGQYPER